jgi:negative elongation factor B
MFFLNQHGVRRLDFHMSALEELRSKLVKRIEELAASNTEQDLETLKNLLEKSFPVRKVGSDAYMLESGLE